MSGGAAPGPAAGQRAGAGLAGQAGARRRGRRRWAAAGAVAVLAVTAVVLAFVGPIRAPAAASPAGDLYHTATAVVARRSLTSQTQVSATLGDAGAYSVVNQAQGTITALPAPGRVVRQGQVLYQVTGGPVVLLYGGVPAWRDLTEGVTGPDVTELNADLVRLGFATTAALGPRPGWDYFGAETAYAVQRLQARLGVTVTGTLALGSVVFLPGAIEVTGLGTGVVLGGTAAPGQVVLTASSTTPVVTIALDAAQQTEVRVGEPVTITLPDGVRTPGVVSQVSNVATAPSSPNSSGNPGNSGDPGGAATIAVLVSLRHPRAAGSLTQAPVEVTITTGTVRNALVVPVTALLAQAGGGYAMEVIGAGGRHRLVAVTPGMFDDAAGLVQVTGPGLAAGQRVVVPAI